ncbi:NADP oxidoreductase [Pseudonocardia alni]|uniref:NADP oxidoreductase n=1 Tax=Pseudonocardia alni TaxID=33907 RepID=UPI00333038D1
MTARPWRVAVVGAGPSGMYAAGYLSGHFDGPWAPSGVVDGVVAGRPVEVDVYDRLPTPWGLVRGGVAPDHPTKKDVTRVFDAVSARPGVRFLGGVELGRDVSVADLAQWYDAVVHAHGARGGARLDVDGGDLPGVHTAHDVVAWYNGHPDHTGLGVDLTGARVIVVGNGNVALDVARVLALPEQVLARTDVAAHAEAALRDAATTEIVVTGRRGPEHAAFGTAELEELAAVPGVDVVVDPADVPADDAALPGPVRRRLDVLRGLAVRGPTGAPRRVTLRFRTRPAAVLGTETVTGVRLEGPGGVEDLATSTVVLAVGYRSAPVEGLPFDTDRHLLPTRDGRVVDADGAAIPGAYATGWIRRGPSGMIGTNKACARGTVAALAADAAAGLLPTGGTLDPDAVLDRLAGHAVVAWEGWRAIDHLETTRGREEGRPRRKLVTHDELHAGARGRAAAAAG